jgi:hypothetical protein
MTNAEWLKWFDAQSLDTRRRVMLAIDALETSGVPGHIAHEAALVEAVSGVPAARIANVMIAPEFRAWVKH